MEINVVYIYFGKKINKKTKDHCQLLYFFYLYSIFFKSSPYLSLGLLEKVLFYCFAIGIGLGNNTASKESFSIEFIFSKNTNCV